MGMPGSVGMHRLMYLSAYSQLGMHRLLSVVNKAHVKGYFLLSHSTRSPHKHQANSWLNLSIIFNQNQAFLSLKKKKKKTRHSWAWLTK